MPLRPRTILLQNKASNSTIAKHVRAAHPDAEVRSIPYAKSSWDGKQHSTASEDHFREKREKVAVIHRGAKWKPDPNGRSTDFLPSVKMGQGCGFFCQYCYVERGKPNSYPKVYDDCYNIVDMIAMVIDDEGYYRSKMLEKCPRGAGKDYEKHRDPSHGPFITFDLGCDTDCTLDNQITRHGDITDAHGNITLPAYEGHIIDIMNQVAEIPGAMTSFATKGTELQPFIDDCNHPDRHRIRLSLMPEWQRRIVEMNTAPTLDRLHMVNTLVRAGFEVHINLSPIIVTKSFAKDYRDLLKLIDDVLTDEAKQQLAYEVIFLTHSDVMHDRVEARRPEAHRMMAHGPLPLAVKPHKKTVTTYRQRDKNKMKPWLRKRIERYTPYARIRYMF